MKKENAEKKHYNLYYIILEDMERNKLSEKSSERIKKYIFALLNITE